uniref:Uncharacterized protein n=1 Tax=Arundo donax TaxID=35708 RepID=A0A0A9GPN1_ARUDO
MQLSTPTPLQPCLHPIFRCPLPSYGAPPALNAGRRPQSRRLPTRPGSGPRAGTLELLQLFCPCLFTRFPHSLTYQGSVGENGTSEMQLSQHPPRQQSNRLITAFAWSSAYTPIQRKKTRL